MKRLKWIIVGLMICFLFSAACGAENITPQEKTEEDLLSHKGRQITTIQVSSHKKAQDAERDMKRLKAHGLDVFIDHETVKDKGMWYRVYVGRFENRAAAAEYAHGLVEKRIIAGFWIKKKKLHVDLDKHTETNQQEIQKPTTEVQRQEESATILTTTPPPSNHADEHDTPASPKDSKQKEEESVLREAAVQKEVAPADTESINAIEQRARRFSIGLKSSVLIANNASDFKIYNSERYEVWSFDKTYVCVGLVANLRLNDRFTIESSIEKDLLNTLDIWQLAIGPKYEFHQRGLITPFLRAGLIIGRLQWDDAPGDFDTGIGLDGGVGIYLNRSKIQLGFETSYRRLKYSYNIPSDSSLSATDDQLDMSGFVFSGTLSYLF